MFDKLTNTEITGPTQDFTEENIKDWIMSNILKRKVKGYKRTFKPENHKLTLENKINILELYNKGFSISQIQKNTQRCPRTIKKILIENNIYIKSAKEILTKYTLNENYFKKIDCPEKAYWLGWLFSDGTVRRNGSQICLKLQVIDKCILKRFKNTISSSAPIKLERNKIKKGSMLDLFGKKKEYSSLKLMICSSKMVRDLAGYGIIWNKGKLSEGIKNVPEEYIPAFILGEFEGDGNIIRKLYGKKGHINCFSIFDIKETCDFIKKYFDKYLKKDIGYVRKLKKSNIFVFSCGRGEEIKAIYNILYEHSGINEFLERKFIKFKEVIHSLNEIKEKRMSNKSSKYRGVAFIKRYSLFQSSCGSIYLGRFNTEKEAAEAYDRKAIELYAGKAILNFPTNE